MRQFRIFFAGRIESERIIIAGKIERPLFMKPDLDPKVRGGGRPIQKISFQGDTLRAGWYAMRQQEKKQEISDPFT